MRYFKLEYSPKSSDALFKDLEAALWLRDKYSNNRTMSQPEIYYAFEDEELMLIKLQNFLAYSILRELHIPTIHADV